MDKFDELRVIGQQCLGCSRLGVDGQGRRSGKDYDEIFFKNHCDGRTLGNVGFKISKSASYNSGIGNLSEASAQRARADELCACLQK